MDINNIMNPATFKDFRYTHDGAVSATNGPIVVNFEVTDTGLKYRALGSNIKCGPAIAAVALKAARFHRIMSS